MKPKISKIKNFSALKMNIERAVKVNDSIQQSVRAIKSLLSTSYGPKGLDKMIIQDKKVTVTNDGATILSYYKANPIHKILCGTSAAQDANCGDGTTSVVLLIGCIYEQVSVLKARGIHPSRISVALDIAKKVALEYIDGIRLGVKEEDFTNVALTCLNSKIASKSTNMAEVAIEALRKSRKDEIKIVKKIGESIDDMKLIDGFLLPTPVDIPEGRHRLLVIQFCLSPPKTNIDSKILINDYTLMEKFVKEEREYIIGLIKAIKKSGATLLILQKSLLKQSCCELAQHFLKKLGIAYIDNVERKDVEFISNKLGIKPVSDVELINGTNEVSLKMEGDMAVLEGCGVSIIVEGCEQTVVDEADRSLNDVLSVVKCLLEDPFIVPGGGSVETGIATAILKLNDLNSVIYKAIAEGFLQLPHLLVQNAGLSAVEMVLQLQGSLTINKLLGISLRTSTVADMVHDDSVIQPSLVCKSMVKLAIETVQMLIKIDDILPSIE